MRNFILYLITGAIAATIVAAAISDDAVKRSDTPAWSFVGGTCRGTMIRRADGYEEVTVDGEFIQSIPSVSGSRGVIVSESGSVVIPYIRNSGMHPRGINIDGEEVPLHFSDNGYGSTYLRCGIRGTVIFGTSIIDVENKKINSTLQVIYPGRFINRVLGQFTAETLAVVVVYDSAHMSETVYAVNEDGSDPVELKNAPMSAFLACNGVIVSGFAMAKYNNNWNVVDVSMYGNLYENARVVCAKGGAVAMINGTIVAAL